jgi:hypothetical protein
MNAFAMPAPPVPWTRPRAMSAGTQSNGTVPAQTCTCEQTVAYSCERGETFSSEIRLSITDSSVTPPVKSPVDLTGSTFQFTAKPDPSLPDTDPSTVIIDWQETNTPLQGTTWLKIPAATTHDMQVVAYTMQVRMVSPSGVVTPIAAGTITITEPPVSARYSAVTVVPLGG